MYLAVDPGKGRVDSIGWALFKNNGDFYKMGQMQFGEFTNWLETLEDIKEIIHEDYVVRHNSAQKHVGSRVETVQCIGVIRSYCIRKHIPMHKQPSVILDGAQRLFQIQMPTDHTQSHQISALLHGMNYLYKLGIVKSALEVKLERERNNKT